MMTRRLARIAFTVLLLVVGGGVATHATTPGLALGGNGCSNALPGAGSTVACVTVNLAGRAQIVAAKWCDDATCTTDTSSDTFTITDSSGSTYGSCQRLDSSSGTDRRTMVVCHAQNVAANASNTVTLNVTSGNTVNFAGLIVSEVSGGTASVTLDQHGTTDLASGPSPVSVSTVGATVQGNELIYTFINIDAGTLAVGQPVIGAMGTNYFAGQIGTPTIAGSGTTAMAEWNIASPRNTVKTETMSFNAPGFPLNPTAQRRGIIVTYRSPVNESPTAVTFNAQAVGTTSASQTITITNTGSSNLFIGSNAVLGGSAASNYAIVGGSTTCVNGLNIGAGSSCNIVLTFTPSTAGTRAATVSLFTGATGSPHVASLSGLGVTASNQITIN